MPCTEGELVVFGVAVCLGPSESLSDQLSSILLMPHLVTLSMKNWQSDIVAFWVKWSNFHGIWKVSLTKHLTPWSKEKEKGQCFIIVTWNCWLLQQCCKLTSRTSYQHQPQLCCHEPMHAWVDSQFDFRMEFQQGAFPQIYFFFGWAGKLQLDASWRIALLLRCFEMKIIPWNIFLKARDLQKAPSITNS